MERTYIIDTLGKIDNTVKIAGWVKTRRDHGKIVFLDLLDKTGILQVVVVKPELVDGIGIYDVLAISGTVAKRPEKLVNPNSSTGTVELQAGSLKLLGKSKELPFDMDQPDLLVQLPTLLDNRSLTLRHPKIKAVFKIQETIADAFRSTLRQEGFTEIFAPTFVPTATEGGAEVFKVAYYDQSAYLAQSPQFYKQIMVGVFERVFTIAHAYRAEPSVTTRHLSEYVSLDAEFGFINSFTDIMDVVEKVIKSIFEAIEEKNKAELDLLGVTLPPYEKPFHRLKMREAQEILFKRTNRDHRKEPDLDPADEKELCQWALEEYGTPFVFVTHYPTGKRPFYTMPDPEDPEYTLSFDLIGVQEEWVTGGQRINDYDTLIERIEKWGNKPENFETYTEAFRYGMPPEGGFALGLERITKDIIGLANIREASLFPRDMERVDVRLSTLRQANKKPKKS